MGYARCWQSHLHLCLRLSTRSRWTWSTCCTTLDGFNTAVAATSTPPSGCTSFVSWCVDPSLVELPPCPDLNIVQSTDNDKVQSARWGKLACEILSTNWEAAMEEVQALKESIDTKVG